MKLLVVLTCFVAVTFAARMTHLDYQWEEFKASYQKVYYDLKDEAVRRDIWLKNTESIDRHNKEAREGLHTFTLGMNKFGDLEPQEFRKLFLGTFKKSSGFACNQTSIYVSSNNYAPLADKVDWRPKGYVTPIKDQGQCGSCWAFSTTGSVEGQHFKKTGELVSLSEQNLMDCSKPEGDFSCEGGMMDFAFDYIIENKGIDTEASYPYKATDENVCKYNEKNSGATISGCYDVTPTGDEAALKKAAGTVGPISVAIDASQQTFQFYKTGVYSDTNCRNGPLDLDHGVLVVGYGTDNSDGDYWLVKNSWGTIWGDDGYIKMSRNNKNNCGIATSASYPVA